LLVRIFCLIVTLIKKFRLGSSCRSMWKCYRTQLPKGTVSRKILWDYPLKHRLGPN
jgi:hypothetical protein